MRHLLLFLVFFFGGITLFAQIGGQAAYPFLNLTPSARIAALGGNLNAVVDGDHAITMTARFWKWRMHGGAVTMARKALQAHAEGFVPDVILATGMVNLPAFLALALTIEARDPMTNGHCERLAAHAVLLGRTIGLPPEDLEALHRGGYLHDVGKVGVPDSVLLKPGPLTPQEFELMKRHTEIGDMLCAPLQSLRSVRPIVRSHHERLDGSGYPAGLHGDEVPLLAQIVGIVDVYDALTSPRPYRGALAPRAAAQHLAREVEQGRFAREYVDAFLDAIRMVAVPFVH